MSDTSSVSLFAHLRDQLPDTRAITRTSKATLTDLSHLLEDRVLDDQLPSVIFSGFQESLYWKQAEARYDRIENVVQQVCVFVADANDIVEASGPNRTVVRLERTDSLRFEWFVVILTERFSAVMCSRDRQEHAEDESQRSFDTICSFEPALIGSAVTFLLNTVRRYQPDRVSAVEATCNQITPADPRGDYVGALVSSLMHSSQRRQDSLHEALAEQSRLIQTQSLLERTLVELAVPVIPLVPGVIVMPLVGDVDARRSQQVMEALLEGIASKQADVAILDITGVPLIDTNVANNLLQSVRAANMLGAQVILTGIGADIAQTLVHLEVDFSRMQTQANLQDGIVAALAIQQLQIAPLRPASITRKATENNMFKALGG